MNRGYTRTLTGRDWQPFTEAQIAALTLLLKDIAQRYAIAPENIVGHSDVAPQRKQDPGPLFPWRRLAQQGIGAWPEASRVQHYLAGRPAEAPVAMERVLSALSRYGYDVSGATTPRQRQQLIAAFQMHFRPADYRGLPDAETLAIAEALLERYGG